MTTGSNESRDLNTLLNMGTYQGMTDDEIEMLIDYKVQQTVMDSRNLAAIQLYTDGLNTLIAQELENHSTLSGMVQSLMNRQVFLERVVGNNE